MSISPTTFYDLEKLSRLSNRVPHAWSELKKFLEKEGFYLHEFKEDMACDMVIELINNHAPVPFLYRILPNQDILQLSALIEHRFEEHRLNDILLLACHFNELLQNGQVEVRIQPRRVFFRNSLSLKDIILEENALHDAFYSHLTVAQDIKEGFLQLLNENEDPVVIIGNTLRKDRARNA